MKAVVVEINEKFAIVLDGGGSFKKIKNSGKIRVGQEIDIPSVQGLNINTFVKYASIAAIFILVLSLGLGGFIYTQPYSYVDVDINPSIELTVNRFDRIIRVEAMNEDGKKLIESENYWNSGLKSGVDRIMEKAAQKGYIKDNTEGAVLITVTSENENKASKIQENIKGTVSKRYKTEGEDAKVVIEKIDLEKHNEKKTESKKLGITPGKLELIEKLVSMDPEKKVEDLKNKPVREILKEIKVARKEVQEEKKDTKNQPSVKNDSQSADKDKDKKDDDKTNLKKEDKETKGDLGQKKVNLKDKKGNVDKPASVNQGTIRDKINGKVQDKGQEEAKDKVKEGIKENIKESIREKIKENIKDKAKDRIQNQTTTGNKKNENTNKRDNSGNTGKDDLKDENAGGSGKPEDNSDNSKKEKKDDNKKGLKKAN